MLAKIAIFAFFLAAVIAAPGIDKYQVAFSAGRLSQAHFAEWKSHHGKMYHGAEHAHRFSIFTANVAEITAFNQEKASLLGWTKGVNKFSDMTKQEFRDMYLGTKVDLAKHRPVEELVVPDHVRSMVSTGAVSSIDWRTKGAVTPVKDQADCGSCWSFSTTGAIEGFWKIAGNTLIGLSEQNLIDCSTSLGNQGCNGGDMGQAMQYVINNKGIDSESSYPYTATGPNTCEYSSANKAAVIKAFKSIPQGDETALAAALVTGPVSVGIDASELQSYSGGIYAPEDCSSTNLDHGVLAVGFNNAGDKYYIVKNSWATSWGEDGYFRMAKDKNNMCGIATAASIPTA